jgi:N-acetylmuramoyl-L-alanine amidase
MIIRDYITSGTKRRSGLKNSGIKFICSHDVGNPNTTARQNVNYFKNSANEMSASAHTFIDDIDVIECIPLDEKAWHVWYSVQTDNNKYGTDANDSAIGVELCYFPKDLNRTMIAYRNYVEYIAGLCKTYKLNPLTHISGHFQLDPARKTDPMNAFNVIGKTFDAFLQDVNKLVKPTQTISLTPMRMTESGPKIALAQSLLKKGGYMLSEFKEGLYDENMAKSVLFFQLQNKIADNKELAGLRGDVIGPKTVTALLKLQ